MSCRRLLLSLAACTLILSCKGPAPKQADFAVRPPDVGLARHGASEELKKLWPFATPTAALYIDLERLMSTEVVFRYLAKDLSAFAVRKMPLSVSGCVANPLIQIKELAIGGEGAGAFLAVIRFDPATASCLRRIEAYRPPNTDDASVVTDQGLLLTGSRALVERALSGGMTADASADRGATVLELGPDEYAAVSVKIEDFALDGRLLASSERFRVAFVADLKNEQDATEAERALSELLDTSRARLRAKKPDKEAALRRFVKSFALTRDVRRIALTFDLHESPSEQAVQLRAAPAFASLLLTTYIGEVLHIDAWLAEQWKRMSTPK